MNCVVEAVMVMKDDKTEYVIRYADIRGYTITMYKRGNSRSEGMNGGTRIKTSV